MWPDLAFLPTRAQTSVLIFEGGSFNWLIRLVVSLVVGAKLAQHRSCVHVSTCKLIKVEGGGGGLLGAWS